MEEISIVHGKAGARSVFPAIGTLPRCGDPTGSTTCAGSSDCSRSRPRSRSASASTSPRCSSRCRAAGPTRRASPSTAIPAPTGSSKLTLYSADPRRALGRCGTRCATPSARATSRLGPREPRRRRRRRRCRRRRGVGSGEPARPPRDERGRGHRDLQGDGPARGVRERVRARGLPGTPRARPHAHGDREPRDDGGLAPVLDRPRPLPRPQRLALEPQPLRENLRREGIEFQTENDTEVAAGYLAWRLREGATLEQALEGCLDDLDGFYTFAVGTADGFAVLRDPIACKPAVLAETDEWVAMASEWRAIAVLPGADDARSGSRSRASSTRGRRRPSR